MASSTISSSSSSFINQKDVSFSCFTPKCCTRILKNVVSFMAPQQSQRTPSATGSVKNGMTMTEKILARASEKSQLRPGENVWVNVDVFMTHDVCGPPAFDIFKKEFGDNAKVWDREKIVVIPDHYIFTKEERANRNVDILRDYCIEQNIKYFYDIKDLGDFKANLDYKGVCHVALAQEGHCRPGEVLLGTDSHTCTAGAFGQFATGIGNTDAGFVLGTGKLLLKLHIVYDSTRGKSFDFKISKDLPVQLESEELHPACARLFRSQVKSHKLSQVPPTLRFVMDGEMPDYLLAKDLILQIIGEISVSGATYKSMEFVGSTVESLSMEERMTLCNMVIEAGGKNGVIPADATTYKYLEGKTSLPYEPLYSDEQARFDISKLEPLVAKVLSWGSLALIPVAGKALPILLACVLFSNLGASITEVAKDALVAEYGIKNKMAGLQSYAFMALASGGILGHLLGGYSLLRLPPRSMCLAFAGFLSLQLTMSLATREESLGLVKPINQTLVSKSVLQTFKEQYSDLVVAISDENISRPLMWIVASIALVPILSGSIFCYQTQCLNLSPSIIGMSRVTSQIILLSVTLLYGRFWRNVPLRKLIGMVQTLYATSLFLDLALVNQLNLKFGISNEIFTLCFSGMTEAIAQFKLLPFQMLIAGLAPPGCEGSLMSFMASAVCLSSIVSGFLGVGLASVLGITSDNYSNLSLGIIVQFIAALVSLQWLYYVPVSQPSSEQVWKKGRSQRTRKVGRMMFNPVDEYRRERRSGYRNKRLLQD